MDTTVEMFGMERRQVKSQKKKKFKVKKIQVPLWVVVGRSGFGKF